METSAVSPLYMYSSGSTARALTQPVPVVVITQSTRRLNAPVRWSSRTAKTARSRALGAESNPTYTRIGDTARAMTLLDEAVANRSNCLMFLRNDPRLQPLRQHPHFQILLSRVGLDDVSVASYKR